jgi:paraquat-inducible protein A
LAHTAVESAQHTFGTRLLACPECDLLQCEPRGPLSVGTVSCVRCGATLYRCSPRSLDVVLAFSLACAALFVLANAYPVMSLDLGGRVTSETLFGMSHALTAHGMASVGVLIFTTVIAMPGAEIGALLWMLVPLRLGVVPPGMTFAARLLCAVRPWAMMEVLLLAALVSITRLEKVAHLTLGVAFWSLVAMMLLFAVIDSLLDPRDVWSRVEALQGPTR